MYQIIPMRYLAIAAGMIAITNFVLLGSVTTFAVPVLIRYAILGIDLLLFVLTLKSVWRWLWRKIPNLNNYFPDLNGEYDIELRHNWPIQQRMLDAASGRDEKFDPLSPETKMPEMAITKLKGAIDLSFYWVRVEMWPELPEEPGAVIDRSRTLAANLIRACDGLPNRLAYIYQQKNRRDRQAITDDSLFEGAAILHVEGAGSVLRGEYWTNRAWHRGLSTAGQIVFRKRT